MTVPCVQAQGLLSGRMQACRAHLPSCELLLASDASLLARPGALPLGSRSTSALPGLALSVCCESRVRWCSSRRLDPEGSSGSCAYPALMHARRCADQRSREVQPDT